MQRIRMQIASAAKALIFAALGFSAAAVALGSGSSSSQSQEDATAGVLAWPGGHAIVVVIGFVVISIGVAGVVKGVKKSFADEIDTSSMSPVARAGVARLGQVGYVVKGLSLCVVGALVSYAALTFERQQAPGLDGALHTIVAQPFGRAVLTALAIGFGAFGIFTLLGARYRRM